LCVFVRRFTVGRGHCAPGARPTTVKQRILAQATALLRIDSEVETDLTPQKQELSVRFELLLSWPMW
jgi:bifunctional ADP-heptose synthase (sugar kinase/adenylyltransferase)